MKKIVASLFLFLIGSPLFADGEADVKREWGMIMTSHTVGATAGAVLFTSAPIRLEGVLISSPAVGSYLAFFASTNSVFKLDIATQIGINTDYQSINTNPVSLDLWGTENTSFTYVNHTAGSDMTIFFRCKDSIYLPYNAATGSGYNGICPGLPWGGTKGRPQGQP